MGPTTAIQHGDIAVKIFRGSDTDKLEEMVNDFVYRNRAIEIKVNTCYVGDNPVDNVETSITIIYQLDRIGGF